MVAYFVFAIVDIGWFPFFDYLGWKCLFKRIRYLCKKWLKIYQMYNNIFNQNINVYQFYYANLFKKSTIMYISNVGLNYKPLAVYECWMVNGLSAHGEVLFLSHSRVLPPVTMPELYIFLFTSTSESTNFAFLKAKLSKQLKFTNFNLI